MWPIVVKDDLHNNTVEGILQYKEHYYVYIKYTKWKEDYGQWAQEKLLWRNIPVSVWVFKNKVIVTL